MLYLIDLKVNDTIYFIECKAYHKSKIQALINKHGLTLELIKDLKNFKDITIY